MTVYLCNESFCPACGAPCQKRQDHVGQHDCINCGTKWSGEMFDEESGEKP